MAKHVWEEVTEAAVDWMEANVKDIVAALRTPDGRSPFAADVSESDKLAFYRTKFFNEDGTPNDTGRAETLARVGVEGYVRIMRALGLDAEAKYRIPSPPQLVVGPTGAPVAAGSMPTLPPSPGGGVPAPSSGLPEVPAPEARQFFSG